MTVPRPASSAAAARWDAALMHNYATPQIELVSGSGAVLTDADGRDYIDLLGGIAVSALGHAHPAIVAAVSGQIARLGHVSNYYSTPPTLDLAEKLLAVTGLDGRVIFTNSGTESNEVAFKLARLTCRPRIIATERGFHGRTMGSLAMTGQPDKRAAFEPMPAGVEFVPYGDADALAAAIGADPGSVAAFICEPVQGESGVHLPPADYLVAARRLTAEAGALLILDEVQTGIGRTGRWLASERAGIIPDVVTLAKGLGGGLPLGAAIAVGAAAELLTPGAHGSTFAGNPVCAAAALAVLSTIEADGLLHHAETLGKHLCAGIEAIDHPLIAEVRGAGLLIGIQLTGPHASAAVAAGAEAGFLLGGAGPDVIRLAPPLILRKAQADSFLAALPELLDRTVADPS